MHETSLGGVIRDYLTGETRDCTTYEDLRQALARFLVEERGFDPAALVPRYAVRYTVSGEAYTREADIAMLLPEKTPGLFLLFCAGQINTYKREAQALARLALPAPCPLCAITDTREAELFAVADGATLARGLASLPGQKAMEDLARSRPLPGLTPERRDKESRILHTYTGFLKTCCGEQCRL